jgi:hypothetical protein
MLLQHFYLGLSKELALYLDITARGLFTCETPAEGRKVLDHILENTFFVCETETLKAEAETHHEEALATESESKELPYLDSTPKSSPEPQTPKEEEIQPSEFLYSFEEVIFEDYGNTSNYFYAKRPLIPVTPFDPLNDESLKGTVGGNLQPDGGTYPPNPSLG